jgi:hypothetical protein
LAAPSEAVKVTEVCAASLSELLAPVADEALRVADVATARLSFLQTTVGAEAVRVAEQLIVSGSVVQTSVADEPVRVADSVAVTLTPLETALSDAVAVADLLDRARTLDTTPAEALVVADLVTVGLTVLDAPIIDDVLRVSDAVGLAITPLFVEVGEAIIATDTPVEVLREAAHIDAGPTEDVRVAETLAVLLQPLRATPVEVVRISDPIRAVLVGRVRGSRLLYASVTATGLTGLSATTSHLREVTVTVAESELEPV